jgi:hypothetical protein
MRDAMIIRFAGLWKSTRRIYYARMSSISVPHTGRPFWLAKSALTPRRSSC